jgi:hypothetical protein
MAQHEKTLQAIFDQPTRSDIAWRDIEALFKHLGASITEGKGSRVRVKLNWVGAVFHRPHPQKEAVKGSVRKVREFLETAGVSPDV